MFILFLNVANIIFIVKIKCFLVKLIVNWIVFTKNTLSEVRFSFPFLINSNFTLNDLNLLWFYASILIKDKKNIFIQI